MANEVQAATPRSSKSVVARFGERYGVDPTKVMQTLKQTAFRVSNGEVTDAQMMALLIVAEQHGLNPFTKEIYAFPDKQNGIVPVVGVDGWSRIMNEHPQMDGIEFRYSDTRMKPDHCDHEGFEWIECLIYRKDRSHPVIVREYLEEVYRKPFMKNGNVIKGPWQTHVRRFHRHKTQIQCARIAFGFTGIYDEDEASRIVDNRAIDGEYSEVREPARVAPPQRPALPALADDEFELTLDVWRKAVEGGKKTPNDILAMAKTRNDLTYDQTAAILALEAKREPEVIDQPAETPDEADADGLIPGLD